MVNHKRSYRIYYEENSQVLTGHRKKLQRPNEKGHTSECCAAIAQNRHQASAV
jgi:hypothetical protein